LIVSEREFLSDLGCDERPFRPCEAEPEDYLAMAALQVAADKVDLEMKGEMTDQAVRLQEIERRIDGYLNDIKE